MAYSMPEPNEIQPGVYDITCSDDEKRYRAFLFDGATPTLVDTGLDSTTDALFDGIDRTGLDPERVIVTHGDGDHIGGLDAVVDRYDVETWVPEQTDADIASTPDHRYTGGDRIGRFEAVHVPGHEPDNHVLIDEEAGIAVMGDAVSGSDQRGLPPGYLLLPPAVYSEDLNQAEHNLERLLDYEFEVALTFHGSSVLEDAHEKLDRFVNFPGRP